MRTEDSYRLLKTTDYDSWPEDPSPLQIACDDFDPEAVCELLLDPHPLVRSRGLFVYGFVGKDAPGLLDAALRSADSARMGDRSNLMDALLCRSIRANPRQIATVLGYAEDPEDLVREKFIAFLGAADPMAVTASIELLEGDKRRRFREAAASFDANPDDAQTFFDSAVEAEKLESTFALAALERWARAAKLMAPLHYAGDDYLARGVKANIKRLWIARVRRTRLQAR